MPSKKAPYSLAPTRQSNRRSVNVSMTNNLSVGVDYPCRYVQPDPLEPSVHACIQPDVDEIAALATILSNAQVKMVFSIGCGDGYVEGLIQQHCNITMVGVDLYQPRDDFESYISTTTYLPSVYRVDRSSLLDLDHYRAQHTATKAEVAFMFCFGRRLPWQAYLRAFPWVQHVFIIADRTTDSDSVAQPACDALSQQASWRLGTSIPLKAALPVFACHYTKE
eukprot:m.236533 g.236533  ORF g.236533 m.236533 type:complete len:222 (-) comp17414_c0_seq2:1136-1801(-)